LFEAIVFQWEREFGNHFTSQEQLFKFIPCHGNMTPFKTLLLIGLVTALIFTSCIHKSYYQSPVQGNIPSFHAIPLASDSLKSAVYVTATLSLGGMNERLRDNVISFQGGLHRSHAIDHFRMYYGASLAVGNYNVKRYDYYYYDTYYADTISINKNAGGKLFGAYGGYGGISAAARMGRRGEWRYIGIEGNLFNEFGDYYTFRKSLPDSAATTIDKKKYLGSLGISTELIFKGRSQNKFGMKFAFGSYLRSLPYNNGRSSNPYNTQDNLLYFSNTYHFTVQKTTTYVQLNFATHAANVQFGFNYRL